MRGRYLRFRSGLFQKYFLALFLAVVLSLVANGASDAWFGYRDQRSRLDQLLGVEVRSAAATIHGFLDGITHQLGWLVQLPWSDEPDERRRKTLECGGAGRYPASFGQTGESQAFG